MSDQAKHPHFVVSLSISGAICRGFGMDPALGVAETAITIFLTPPPTVREDMRTQDKLALGAGVASALGVWADVITAALEDMIADAGGSIEFREADPEDILEYRPVARNAHLRKLLKMSIGGS